VHLFEAGELVLLLRPRLLMIEAGEVPLRPSILLIREGVGAKGGEADTEVGEGAGGAAGRLKG
jgi:hypothetical protein